MHLMFIAIDVAMAVPPLALSVLTASVHDQDLKTASGPCRPQDQLVVAVAPAAGEVDGGSRAYGHDDDGAPLKAWVWTMRLVVAARDHVFAGADGSAEREFLGVLLRRLETRLGRDSGVAFNSLLLKSLVELLRLPTRQSDRLCEQA